MRSAKFNIEKYYGHDWLDRYQIWKNEENNKLSVELQYEKELDFYTEKVATCNVEDQLALYVDVLQQVHGKKGDLHLLFNSLRRGKQKDRTEEEEIIKWFANRTGVWFEKELSDLLPRVGFKITSPKTIEELLSYELALRPYILKVCETLTLEQTNFEKESNITLDYDYIDHMNIINNGSTFLRNDKGISDFKVAFQALKIGTMVEKYYYEFNLDQSIQKELKL